MQIVGIEPDNISIISASPASGQPEALEVERDTHVLWQKWVVQEDFYM